MKWSTFILFACAPLSSEKVHNLNFGFICQEIPKSSENHFAGNSQDGPRENCENFPEEFQYPTKKNEAQVHIDLCNPVFKNGVLYTTEGGVIHNQDLRIQARNIQYFHRMEGELMVQKIEAEGDLMIQYKGRSFIGSELEFDLTKKTGTIFDGRTFTSIWYVGGEKIQLGPNGNYKIRNAFITASEEKKGACDLFAKKVKVVKDQYVQAQNVRLRLYQVPIFLLPSFRIGLTKSKDPLFDYYINWNKGPKAGLRYQFYSWRDLNLYGRVEYRLSKGWGGAFETEYLPEDRLTTFFTRNYVGTDRLFNAVDSEFRYRVQGAFCSQSKSGKTKTTLTWDKYSDVRMPGDFNSPDFEVNTAMKTIFYVHTQEKPYMASLKLRPRLNSFESIKQDLPTLFFSLRPTVIKNTGVVSSTFLKASYLDFQYSDQLTTSLKSFHSPRVELYEKLYRPTHFGPVTFTPHFDLRGIFYGTSPSHEMKTLGLLSYGARVNLHGQKQFSRYKHVIEPYLDYKALSPPTVSADDHFIFSIQDGYHQIQQIEIGIHNLLFSKKRSCKEASFTADLYANAFFADTTIPQLIPRLYLYLAWRLPSVHVTLHNCYNFRHDLMDFSKARLKWTINKDIAFCIEGRYRSKYDWRKANHDSFILDVTRSERQLLDSPLSDRRVTFLTNAFIRLTPFWELAFETHHGFHRLFKNHIKEEPYNEFQIHLYTWISSAWKLHLYYGYTLHNHFDWTINFQLVKKGF